MPDPTLRSGQPSRDHQPGLRHGPELTPHQLAVAQRTGKVLRGPGAGEHRRPASGPRGVPARGAGSAGTRRHPPRRGRCHQTIRLTRHAAMRARASLPARPSPVWTKWCDNATGTSPACSRRPRRRVGPLRRESGPPNSAAVSRKISTTIRPGPGHGGHPTLEQKLAHHGPRVVHREGSSSRPANHSAAGVSSCGRHSSLRIKLCAHRGELPRRAPGGAICRAADQDGTVGRSPGAAGSTRAAPLAASVSQESPRGLAAEHKHVARD